MTRRLRFTGWNRNPGAQKGPWLVLVTQTGENEYRAELDKEALNWPTGTGTTEAEAVKNLEDAWSREMRADYGPQDFVVTSNEPQDSLIFAHRNLPDQPDQDAQEVPNP